MNEKILNLLKDMYPDGVLFHDTLDMGIFEYNNQPLYYSSIKPYWKKETDFSSISDEKEIVYFSRLDYEEYQKQVLTVLEDQENPIEKLLDLAGTYGKNRTEFLIEGHYNERIATMLWNACKGNEIYTEHTILDDEHIIGEYDNHWFETEGKRPEEFIYERLYLKNHPKDTLYDFLIGDYQKPEIVVPLLKENGLLPSLKDTKDKEEPRKFRYYLTERPIGPGTVPKDYVVDMHSYDGKIALKGLSRDVYGYIETEVALPNDIKEQYELFEEGELRMEKEYFNNVVLITKDSARRIMDDDAMDVHRNCSLAAIDRVCETLYENSWTDVLIFSQTSYSTRDTDDRRVFNMDEFYDRMQDLNYKDGFDVGINKTSRSLLVFGYDENGAVAQEYSFASIDAFKGDSSLVREMLAESDSKEGLSEALYNEGCRRSDLNKMIIQALGSKSKQQDTKER